MKPPKVTVCVPAYNSEMFIEDTVRSLINQDYPNYEVIVIDNASTDKTGEIVRKVKEETGAKHLSCIRFDELVPPSKNWSRAFAIAKEGYVAIYHSDDMYEQNAVSAEAGFLTANPECGAVFSAWSMISGKGEKLGETERPKEFSSGKISAKELIEFSTKNGYFPLLCPSFMVRLDTAKKCGAFDPTFRYAFDMDYYMRLFGFGKLGFIADKVTRYRQHRFQAVVRMSESLDTQKEFFVILDREIKKHNIALLPDVSRRFEAHRRWGKAIDATTHLRAGDEKGARSLTRESLSFSDALIDFPSRRFLFRFAFSSTFLVSQYLFLGKQFVSLVFWYKVKKRG